MNQVKRWMGWIWMALGPLVAFLLIHAALRETDRNPGLDAKIQWGIFMLIFLPIAFGLVIFGWYAWKGYYDHLPERSAELED
jgi:hypothetical protein